MKKLVCIAMLTVSLVACSKKDANNSNFQEAIQKGFDEGRANHSAGMCLSINTNGSMRLGIIFDEDSQKISIGDSSSDVVTQERIDTLTDAGLIDPESNDGHTFKVSEMGKPFLRNVLDNRYPAFCTGRYTIKVESFSEPVNDGKRTYSEVAYTATLGDQAPWSNNQKVQKAMSSMVMEPHYATVYLTDNGWVMEDNSDTAGMKTSILPEPSLYMY